MGEHESATTKNGCVVLVFGLSSLSGLSLVVVLLELSNGGCLLAHIADHERHGEVVEAVSPRDLHDDM